MTATPGTTASARATAAVTTLAPREVLTLRLGAEEYGIDILRVQEIRSYEVPTRIANAPPHILGVTNLRGVIVPIVDLRARMGMTAAYDTDTVTVVLNVGQRTIGAVVDAVSDVVALGADDVRPPPEFSGHVVDASHITGIATLTQGERERMLILIDIEQLMSSTEMGLVETSLQ